MDTNYNVQRRDNFLLAMYGQMWANVDRHIMVIWQSVAALLGAFAVFALIQKNVLPIDLACSLLVIICAWVGAHVVDANYWFARNLVIIANIERQFLVSQDLQQIHPYFAGRRKPTVLDHLAIQGWLAVGVYMLVVGWHFWTRVVPGFSSPWHDLQAGRSVPYIVTLVAGVLLIRFIRKQKRSYRELVRASPGIPVGEPDSAATKANRS